MKAGFQLLSNEYLVVSTDNLVGGVRYAFYAEDGERCDTGLIDYEITNRQDLQNAAEHICTLYDKSYAGFRHIDAEEIESIAY